MWRNTIFALVLGLGGAAILISLGVWQMQRLAWKEAIIAEAEAMIDADPVALPQNPSPDTDRYRAVRLVGRFTGEEAHVLTSTREGGPGFRVIGVFETDARRVLVDRGYVPEAEKTSPRPPRAEEIVGNLVWPDDVTSSTPGYNADRAIWYGRDVPAMSDRLQTEPIMIVARSDTGDGILSQPVTTAGFRNDHFQYAVTWFLLAAVWLGMTVYLLWRIRARTV